eukprot:gb/GFBE01009806.1/.p1 GENE.gb/GFBE01009806.1/~~gb/GFBE01009806.1/.p1  ORF type:complete len:258 (+),score=64.93 gb/GFBE01009806.1/:1-774(+)
MGATTGAKVAIAICVAHVACCNGSAVRGVASSRSQQALSAEPAAGPVAVPVAAPAASPAAAPVAAPAAAPVAAAAAAPTAGDIHWSQYFPGGDYWAPAAAVQAKSLGHAALRAGRPEFADLDNIERDNLVSVNEAATYAAKQGIPWSQMKDMFGKLDEDGDFYISEDEYRRQEAFAPMKDLSTQFSAVDMDGDSMLSQKEWMAYCHGWLTPKPSPTVCSNIFTQADVAEPKELIDRSEFESGSNSLLLLVQQAKLHL